MDYSLAPDNLPARVAVLESQHEQINEMKQDIREMRRDYREIKEAMNAIRVNLETRDANLCKTCPTNLELTSHLNSHEKWKWWNLGILAFVIGAGIWSLITSFWVRKEIAIGAT